MINVKNIVFYPFNLEKVQKTNELVEFIIAVLDAESSVVNVVVGGETTGSITLKNKQKYI